MFHVNSLPHGSWLVSSFSPCPASSMSAGVSFDSALLHPSILSLVVLPILPVWLTASQLVIKPIRVANLYNTEKDYSTAA